MNCVCNYWCNMRIDKLTEHSAIDFKKIKVDWILACKSKSVPWPKAVDNEFNKRISYFGTKRHKCKLDFKGCQLNDAQVKCFVDVLVSYPVLSRIELQNNYFTHKAVIAFIDLLSYQLHHAQHSSIDSRLEFCYIDEISFDKNLITSKDRYILDVLTNILNYENVRICLRRAYVDLLQTSINTPLTTNNVYELWETVTSSDDKKAVTKIMSGRKTIQYTELEAYLIEYLIQKNILKVLLQSDRDAAEAKIKTCSLIQQHQVIIAPINTPPPLKSDGNESINSTTKNSQQTIPMKAILRLIQDDWMDACNLHKIALNSDVEKEFTKRFSHAGTANEKKKLDFSNCQLSDVHIKCLMKVLCLFPCFSKLQLYNNIFMEKGVQYLFNLLYYQVHEARHSNIDTRLHSMYFEEVLIDSKLLSSDEKHILDVLLQILKKENFRTIIRRQYLEISNQSLPLLDQLQRILKEVTIEHFESRQLSNLLISKETLDYLELEAMILDLLSKRKVIAEVSESDNNLVQVLVESSSSLLVDDNQQVSQDTPQIDSEIISNEVIDNEGISELCSLVIQSTEIEDIITTESAVDSSIECNDSKLATTEHPLKPNPCDETHLSIGELVDTSNSISKDSLIAETSHAVSMIISNQLHKSTELIETSISSSIKSNNSNPISASDSNLLKDSKFLRKRHVKKLKNLIPQLLDLSIKKLETINDNLLSSYATQQNLSLQNIVTIVFRSNSLSDFEIFPLLDYCCPYLQYLDLGDNLFTGVIPLLSLCNIQLKRLDLSHNKLTDITNIVICETLEFIDVSHNMISKINSLPKHLQYLDVSYNNIQDTMDIRMIAMCVKLETLRFHDNPVSTSHDSEDLRAKIRVMLITVLPSLLILDNELLSKGKLKKLPKPEISTSLNSTIISKTLLISQKVEKKYISKMDQLHKDSERVLQQKERNDKLEAIRQKYLDDYIKTHFKKKVVSKDDYDKLQCRLLMSTFSSDCYRKELHVHVDVDINEDKHYSFNKSHVGNIHRHDINVTSSSLAMTSNLNKSPLGNNGQLGFLPTKKNAEHWLSETEKSFNRALNHILILIDNCNANANANANESSSEAITTYHNSLSHTIPFFPNVDKIIPRNIIKYIEIFTTSKEETCKQCELLIRKMRLYCDFLHDIQEIIVLTNGDMIKIKDSIQMLLKTNIGRSAIKNLFEPVGIDISIKLSIIPEAHRAIAVHFDDSNSLDSPVIKESSSPKLNILESLKSSSQSTSTNQSFSSLLLSETEVTNKLDAMKKRITRKMNGRDYDIMASGSSIDDMNTSQPTRENVDKLTYTTNILDFKQRQGNTDVLSDKLTKEVQEIDLVGAKSVTIIDQFLDASHLKETSLQINESNALSITNASDEILASASTLNIISNDSKKLSAIERIRARMEAM